MNKRDAEQVVKSLMTETFICADKCLVLSNGYVILRKEYFEKLKGSLKDEEN